MQASLHNNGRSVRNRFQVGYAINFGAKTEYIYFPSDGNQNWTLYCSMLQGRVQTQVYSINKLDFTIGKRRSKLWHFFQPSIEICVTEIKRLTKKMTLIWVNENIKLSTTLKIRKFETAKSCQGDLSATFDHILQKVVTMQKKNLLSDPFINLKKGIHVPRTKPSWSVKKKPIWISMKVSDLKW